MNLQLLHLVEFDLEPINIYMYMIKWVRNCKLLIVIMNRLGKYFKLTLFMMTAEFLVFEPLTITVKCTIRTGLEFINMVQLVISTGDQFPSLLQCLLISTPERKLGCNSEHI